VNLKSVVIGAAALAVVGFALYLFIQVRATPAQAQATQVTKRPPEPVHAPTPTPTPAPEPARAPTKPKLEGLPKTPAEVTELYKRPVLGREVDGPPAPTPADDTRAGLKLDNMMELANKSYDSQNFDDAIAIAQKVLAKDPNNVRMLRIVVSANCIQGDSVVAQQAYEKLPAADREQMRARCDRYGVSFKEPSQ
jgi:hypothetical protein